MGEGWSDRHGQKQPLPRRTPAGGDACEELVVDESNGLEVQVQRVKIEQRHAEFVRRRDRDVACVGRAARHQLGDDARLALTRDVQASCIAASSTTPSCTRRCGRRRSRCGHALS